LLFNAYLPLALRSNANTLYPPGGTNAEAKDSYVGLLTYAQFTSTTRRTAQCVSLNQTEPVWRYLFSHRLSPSIPIAGDWGESGVNVYSIAGEKLLLEKNSPSLDLTKLPAGAYFLRIQTALGNFQGKVLKLD
jgi:hypothetical protein